MSQEKTKTIAQPQEKYCTQCGQKTFRPHRSIKELLWEFVENWFGYDSKAYKTAVALAKPATLSIDYFRNSHHNNHYVTPIRLYIFLSIIFLLLTNFGGFNLTEIEVDGNVTAALVEQEVENAEPTQAVGGEVAAKTGSEKILVNGSPVIVDGRCVEPAEIVQIWPQWLDGYFDKKVTALCDTYANILYLPKEKQTQAKIQFGLALGQSAIEALPQTFLLTMPLLALVLQLLYFRQRHLYVENLVLLIHSHCYMFAMILLYLGWYQLTQAFSWLEYIPLGTILLLWIVIYLYISMKRFYEQNYWKTTLKFIVFSTLYLIVFGFITIFAMLAALMSV